MRPVEKDQVGIFGTHGRRRKPQDLQRRANQENQEEHADDRWAFGSSGWRGTARPPAARSASRRCRNEVQEQAERIAERCDVSRDPSEGAPALAAKATPSTIT